MATDYWPDLSADVAGIIQGAWPDVTSWDLVQDLEKESWQEEQAAGERVAPWAVVYMQTFGENASDFPSNCTWYDAQIAFYYVQVDTEDPTSTLMAKLNTMEDYLRSHSFNALTITGTAFQRATGNDSQMGSLLQQKLGYSAGGVTVAAAFPGSNVPHV